MNKIRCLIVDDEPRLAKGLQALLEKNFPFLDSSLICHNVDDAIKTIETEKPELVFLDISLPGKNAFDLLNEIPAIDFEIIFITAHDQYAIQAFQYSAVAYLLKPVLEDELVAAVHKATERLNNVRYRDNVRALVENIAQAQPQKLCVPTLSGFQIIPLDEILYCEANGAYTNFMLLNKKCICASKPLAEYEFILKNGVFIRIHKSYLINLHHLSGYNKGEGGTVHLIDGTELEVSRRKKNDFLERIRLFFKG